MYGSYRGIVGLKLLTEASQMNRHYRVKFICIAYLTILLTLNISLTQAKNDTSEAFIWGGLAWSADGQTIAVGTINGVWLHDSDNLSDVRLLSDLDGVTIVAASHHDDRLIIGTADGTIEIWGINDGERINRYSGHARSIYSIDWSPDDGMVASSSADDTVQLWEPQTGILRLPIEIEDVPYPMTVSWSGDGARFAISEWNGLSIYQTRSGGLLHYWLDTREAILSMVWSPDGTEILGGSSDHILVWNAEGNFVESLSILQPEETDTWNNAVLRAIAWSPDSSQFALHVTKYGYDNFASVLQIWDRETRQILHEIEPIIRSDPDYTNGVAWSPSGDRIASTSDDGHIYVWNAETFELLSEYSGYKSLTG